MLGCVFRFTPWWGKKNKPHVFAIFNAANIIPSQLRRIYLKKKITPRLVKFKLSPRKPKAWKIKKNTKHHVTWKTPRKMRCCTFFCTTLEQPPLRSPKNIHPTDIPKESIRNKSLCFFGHKKFEKTSSTPEPQTAASWNSLRWYIASTGFWSWYLKRWRTSRWFSRRDLFYPPIVGGHQQPFQRVTFSPCPKIGQQAELPGLFHFSI